MTKSFVGLEQAMCPVCGCTHDTGILLNRRLKEVFRGPVVTHWAMCPEHQGLKEKGFVALVEFDPARSELKGGTASVDGAYRTGPIAHLRREAFELVFGMEPHPSMMTFVEEGVIDKLRAMVAEEGGDNG